MNLGPAPDTGSALALGLDIGGTSTRALVVGLDGTRRGAGRAGGANLTSHSLATALAAVASALDQTLAGVDAAQVVSAVIGTAGDRNLAVPEIADALRQTWTAVGLTCDYVVVSDAAVAFAAGASASGGTLVLSGTGALVARMEGVRLAHVVDGHGWLLGDLGSGFWLGHQAVRNVLRSFDVQQAPGPLGRAVLEALTGSPETDLSREDSSELVRRVHERPPIALAELAPLVTRLAGDDPGAAGILDRAAGHLLDAATIVRPEADASPLVLAGSLLTTDTPLARRVRPQLADTWPDAHIGVALDGAAGAAWIAATRIGEWDDAARTELHRRLFA